MESVNVKTMRAQQSGSAANLEILEHVPCAADPQLRLQHLVTQQNVSRLHVERRRERQHDVL